MSAALAVQGAIVTALKADAGVLAYVRETNGKVRVYDDVPPDATFPYISIGPSQSNRQDADCFRGSEVFIQVDVWSRERGYTECKRLGDAVETALNDLDTVNGGLSFTIDHRFTNYLRDNDGITSHGVLSFRAEIHSFIE